MDKLAQIKSDLTRLHSFLLAVEANADVKAIGIAFPEFAVILAGAEQATALAPTVIDLLPQIEGAINAISELHFAPADVTTYPPWQEDNGME
jgi:hypothetical protein